MQILWTILVLGSLLQGAYAESGTPTSTTDSVKDTTRPTISQQSSSQPITQLSVTTITPLTTEIISTVDAKIQTKMTPGNSDYSTNSSTTTYITTVSVQTSTTAFDSESQSTAITTSPGSQGTSNTIPFTNTTTENGEGSSQLDASGTSQNITTVQVKILTSPTTLPPTIASTQTATPPKSTETPATTPSNQQKHHQTNQTTSLVLKDTPFTRTVAPNSTGDSLERACFKVGEIFNATINCSMTGSEIDGVFKYKTVIINAEDMTTSNIKETTPAKPSKSTAATTVKTTPLELKDTPFTTVAPNSTGDSLERACFKVGEIFNATINCSMTGSEIDGVFKYKTVVINVFESSEQSNNSNDFMTLDNLRTLIAILASCGALALILCAFALCCKCHGLSYRKKQQHLTEEMQTVENGYHDNPTLEVMEVQPEMQEKKLAHYVDFSDSDFSDSWIVPFDNLSTENMLEEEDTHL
ncbi:hypothetical protein AMELA_G00182150 [Ameiurus melas]|uniref:Podocalyxin n=1 Tax=Ameiurus melas TaxID=219545 RepID=A0A7J6ACH8_AMEME|nr:hypothetical protein AMELA_G00182150 [Ameiurus melas]